MFLRGIDACGTKTVVVICTMRRLQLDAPFGLVMLECRFRTTIHVLSRVHLLCVCPHTADLRDGVPSPVDRVEERLFAKVVHERPAAPSSSNFVPFVADATRFLDRALQGDKHIFVAADGAAKHGASAFSVVIPSVNFAAATGPSGEDQTPVRAELDALGVVCNAAYALSERGVTGDITLVTDCISAMSTFETSDSSRPLLALQLRRWKRRANAMGLHVHLFWVPAHDRIVPHWKPHPLASEAQLRAWNRRADSMAGEWRATRSLGSNLQSWHDARVAARNWEMMAIRSCAAVTERYNFFLDSLCSSSGPRDHLHF